MHKEKEQLVLDYQKEKDPLLKEKVAVAYKPLVEYIARKLVFNWDDVDDLVQVGSIGLLKSLEAFDPSKEVTFSTYASSSIIGEIKHYLRDKSRIVKMPRKLQEQYSKIRFFTKEFTQEHDRCPTIAEIAEGMDVTEEFVLESLEAGTSTQVVSLDKPLYTANSGSDESLSLMDSLGIDAGDELLDRELLTQAMDTLPERGRKILFLRYYEGLTQKEIADRMDLSQMHISRLLNESIKTLRRVLEA